MVTLKILKLIFKLDPGMPFGNAIEYKQVFQCDFWGSSGLIVGAGPRCPVYPKVFKKEHRTILVNKNTPKCTPTITPFVQMQWLITVALSAALVAVISVFGRALR